MPSQDIAYAILPSPNHNLQGHPENVGRFDYFETLKKLPFSNRLREISFQEAPLSTVLWETRALDMLVQVVLIFCGVLGLLGILGEAKAPITGSLADEMIARRERELAAMQQRALVGGED